MRLPSSPDLPRHSDAQHPDRAAADVVMVRHVAEQWIGLAAPLEFRRVVIDTDQRAIFALRYEQLRRLGEFTALDHPNRWEHDQFDAQATHVAGWRDGKLVAAARVVLPDDEGRLPVERQFHLEIAGRFAEIGRVVARPVAEAAGHRVFQGILGAAMLAVLDHGYLHLLGSASRPVTRIYRQLGIEFKPLLPMRGIATGERFPVAIDTVATARRVLQQ